MPATTINGVTVYNESGQAESRLNLDPMKFRFARKPTFMQKRVAIGQNGIDQSQQAAVEEFWTDNFKDFAPEGAWSRTDGFCKITNLDVLGLEEGRDRRLAKMTGDC